MILGSKTLTTGGANTSPTFAGVISGAGGNLVVGGTGTFYLTGANTYTGNTTINSGATLQIGSGGTVGSLASSQIIDNGTLNFNRTDTALNIASIISGTGAVRQIGTGTTTLSGNNTFTGAYSLTAGTLVLTGTNSAAGAITTNAGTTLQIGDGTTDGSLGTGTVTNSGTLSYRNTGSLTLSQGISGAGTLVVGASSFSNTGTLIVTGTAVITGGITINSGATLQLGNGTASGTLSGTTTNNGTLVYNKSGSTTWSQVISGATGNLTVNSGSLTLSGTNSYGGTTTIASGATLQLGTALTGTLGTGPVVDNGTLNINHTNAFTLSNLISGTGNVAQRGTGTTTLSANNTFSGFLSVSGGILIVTGTNASVSSVTIAATKTLQIGDGVTSGSVGTSATPITDYGTLNFNMAPGGTTTLGSVISNTGNLTVTQGTLILTGANTYSGTTTISAGTTLQINDGGSLGTSAVANSGSLVFANTIASSPTVAGVISGTGTISQTGTGTTTLSGNNTDSGTIGVTAGTLVLSGSNSTTAAVTIASGATLQIGAGSTTGSLASTTISNSGTLAFNRSDAVSVSMVLSGTGNIGQLGTGTTTLSADNTFSGTLNVAGGTLVLSGNNSTTAAVTIASGATLQIGAGSTTGALASTSISNSGTLAFNRSDALTIASVLSGTGSLSQQGTGTTTFSGNNTFSGALDVTAGTLILSGSNSTTATATISSGATLQIGAGGTTGSLASASIVDNGTLVFNRTDTGLNLASIISGTGAVSQTGTGTTALSGNNTFSGAIGITAGTLILSGSNATAATTTISAGATLQIGDGVGGSTGSAGSGAILDNGSLIYASTGSTTLGHAISGSGTLGVNAGTLTLAGSNTYTGATTLTGTSTLVMGSGSTLSSSAQVDLQSANSTWNLGDTSQTIEKLTGVANSHVILGASSATTLSVTSTVHNSVFSGIISGAGGVTKGGTGTTLTLSGMNTYTGITNVYNGTLAMGAANALSGSTTVAIGVTSTFSLAGFNQSIATISGAGTVSLGGGNLSLTPAANGNYSGSLQGNGNLTLSETNAANYLVLSGTNTMTGAMTVTQGVLIVKAANANVTSLTVGANGVFQFGDNGIATAGSLGALTPISNAGLVDFNLYNNTSFANVISGAGNLRQRGAGAITLSANNTYSGTLSVTTGTLILSGSNSTTATATISPGATLQIGAGGTTGSLASASIVDNGTLNLNRSDALTVAGLISGTGSINKNGSGTTTLSADNTLTGAISLTGGSLIVAGATDQASSVSIGAGLTLQINDGGSLGTANIANGGSLVFANTVASSPTLAGVISGTGTISQTGTGTTTLSGNNTDSGTIGITAGKLILSGSNSTTAAVTIASGATLQIGAGSTTGSLASTTISNSGTLAFNRSDAVSVSMVLSGAGNIGQLGTGTTTLSADNTFSGALNVAAGTLILTGANASVTSASVAAGATLQIGSGGATGSLGVATLANDGTFAINKAANTVLTTNITGTGLVSSTITGSLTVNGTITQGSLDLAATNAITIAGAVGTSGNMSVASSAGAVVLDAGLTSSAGHIVIRAAQFTNHVGAAALAASSPGQYWQVWSENPDPFNANAVIGDTPNGLAFDYKHYNATYGVTTVLGTGNGLYYSVAPSINASLTGTVTKPYDGNNTAPLTSANVSVSGLIDGDVVPNSVSGATYAGSNAGSSILVSWSSSGMTAQSSVATGSKTVYGYSFTGGTVTGNIGIITKVAATVTANSPTLTFNGLTQNIAPTAFTATGLVNSETAAVLTGVTATGSGQAVGTYVTSASGTATNYDLSFVNGVLTIAQGAPGPGAGNADYDQFIYDVMKRMKKAPPIDELILSVVCEVNQVAPNNLTRKSC